MKSESALRELSLTPQCQSCLSLQPKSSKVMVNRLLPNAKTLLCNVWLPLSGIVEYKQGAKSSKGATFHGDHGDTSKILAPLVVQHVDIA